ADRLGRRGRLVRQEGGERLRRVKVLGAEPRGAGDPPAPLGEIDQAVRQLGAVLRELHEPPGYHPAHDQVVAVAVRPLAEQVFRRQQRLLGAAGVALRLEMEAAHVEWFPARLRDILDGLLANPLKNRDPAKAESWVALRLRDGPDGWYELRVWDNGLSVEARDRDRLFDLLRRSAPVRGAGPGLGLAVVRWLVEQSGGDLAFESA